MSPQELRSNAWRTVGEAELEVLVISADAVKTAVARLGRSTSRRRKRLRHGLAVVGDIQQFRGERQSCS